VEFVSPTEITKIPRRIKKTMRSALKWVTFGALALALFAYFAYYYIVPHSADGLRIVPATITLDISGPALLDARNKVTITARIQGYIKALHVERNDSVAKGEVLAELDAQEIAHQLLAAQADAEAAKAHVVQARADYDKARAIAAKTKSDFDRKRGLTKKGIVTQADWVATESAFHQAQAELTHAQTTIARAVAQKDSAEANVKVLQVRLNEATILSPFNGVVVARERNVGDLLSPGTPLIQLVDPTSIIISARFDESVMGMIAPKENVTIHFTSMPGIDFKGKILRVIREVDQETREFSVDITLNRLPPHWAMGQRASVVVKAPSLAPVIAIPESFLARQNGRVGVWTLKNGRAYWRQITLGYPEGDKIEVTDGLHPDEFVLPPNGRYFAEPIRINRRSK
jgi:HlyD family secretion protein